MVREKMSDLALDPTPATCGAGVTRDDVVHAYRLLLGREPESEAVIAEKMQLPDIAALRRAFLASDEFKYVACQSAWVCVGDNLAATPLQVETEADPDTLRRILDRIAVAWREYGESEPFWSVSTNEQFRAGSAAAHLESLYASGQATADSVMAALCRNGAAIERIEHCLDFGCGVGRITLALAQRFRKVSGLDISEGHLREARKRAASRGIRNASFRAYSSLDEIASLPSYDLLVSFIVLQHNPPPVIRETLRRLLARLNPNGYAVFQVPIYIRDYQFSVREYLSSEQPQMEMNALPQPDVHTTLREAGCILLEVREDLWVAHPGMVSQTFIVKKADK